MSCIYTLNSHFGGEIIMANSLKFSILLFLVSFLVLHQGQGQQDFQPQPQEFLSSSSGGGGGGPLSQENVIRSTKERIRNGLKFLKANKLVFRFMTTSVKVQLVKSSMLAHQQELELFKSLPEDVRVRAIADILTEDPDVKDIYVDNMEVLQQLNLFDAVKALRLAEARLSPLRIP